MTDATDEQVEEAIGVFNSGTRMADAMNRVAALPDRTLWNVYNVLTEITTHSQMSFLTAEQTNSRILSVVDGWRVAA